MGVNYSQASWNIIGELLSEAIFDFFLKKEDRLLKQLNATVANLLHKVKQCRTTADYRPIFFYCNVLYKFILTVMHEA